jgi:transcriptional regulator PpsR
VNAFKSPQNTLGPLDPDAAATLITAASDIALIIDDRGLIQDLAFNSERLAMDLEGSENWLGQPWAETVTVESRGKIEALLRQANAGAPARWRHVNHVSPRGTQVPVLYSTVQLADKGSVVAFGRDLTDISELQQRLVDAQQSMERDYSRLRHVETRYRLLFEMSAEAVLILDAATLKVVEANPAARDLFGENWKRVLGRAFQDAFDPESQQGIQALLAGIRALGRAEEVRVRLLEGAREVTVTGSLFRQESSSLFLVRIVPTAGEVAAAMPEAKLQLLKVIENAPDGFVVVGADERIIAANAAFCDMVQLPSEEQARGEMLDRWLGRPGVDLDVLLANLRQRGSVRLFATVLRGAFGDTVDVEVSAVSVVNGGQPCFGFAIRNVGRRMPPPGAGAAGPTLPRELPRSVEQLTELVGRVSLKELVREATDVIEKLCIEAALELTGDNRASAAEMLGLSRQSLYVKLRRYGLGDLAEDTQN